jgi:hypothetical protein
MFPPPPRPITAAAVGASEDVEHPVGRRLKAHGEARGGGGAGQRQRRPGVGYHAEAVHVVEVACGGRRGARARAHSRTGAGRGGRGKRGLDADEAGGRASLGCSDQSQRRPSLFYTSVCMYVIHVYIYIYIASASYTSRLSICIYYMCLFISRMFHMEETSLKIFGRDHMHHVYSIEDMHTHTPFDVLYMYLCSFVNCKIHQRQRVCL